MPEPFFGSRVPSKPSISKASLSESEVKGRRETLRGKAEVAQCAAKLALNAVRVSQDGAHADGHKKHRCQIRDSVSRRRSVSAASAVATATDPCHRPPLVLLELRAVPNRVTETCNDNRHQYSFKIGNEGSVAVPGGLGRASMGNKEEMEEKDVPPQLVQPIGLPFASRFGSSIDIKNGGTLCARDRQELHRVQRGKQRPLGSSGFQRGRRPSERRAKDALLLRLHEQVLQVEQGLLGCLHVDERRGDTGLAGTTRTTTLMGIVLFSHTTARNVSESIL